ncbi:MAG: ROK family protein [Candidatus Aminicenantes bacterium]|nr:ROK family protein [Candidatus Aminicenantes bacterium]
MLYAGFDLGGTQLKYGVIDSRGKVVYKNKTNSPPDIEQLLETISRCWQELTSIWGKKIYSVGFGFAGFFSLKKKRILNSPNYQALNNFPLFPALRKILPVPFSIHNDANLAAYGEYLYGSGKKAHSLVFLTIGTGVGSGIILNGELWQGTEGFAGELGHITVNPDGFPCNCGSRGCLETEVSATALVRNYREFKPSDENLTARDVYLRARKGDRAAVKSFEKCGYFLGLGLSIVINFLNPEKIILGGGVMNSGNWLLKPTLSEVKKRAIPFSLASCEIKKASLGNDAGFIGAAAWARSQARRSGSKK